MNKTNNPDLTDISQKLRTEMTPEEKHLWYDFLKKLPVTVNRQKVIGKYIADFYCASAKIIIELDGSQHYNAENRLYDKERDAFLESLGISVLRYSNFELNNNFEGVCADIMKHIPPHPSAVG
ncbi:MAG: endonuclease domain-containing protein [Clostridia bacterium]|nr:endonuclease domain-containing protein [Clostridia bacterium]